MSLLSKGLYDGMGIGKSQKGLPVQGGRKRLNY
jgi:hypothetical protein